ncbi:MAG: FAD-dependent oxidoreductase [Acidimicrobiales bacterium]
MSSEQTDLVVVGGGLAGLITAAHGASRGLGVTIIERNVAEGGRARTTEKNGFYLNQGAHALYHGGAGGKALAAVGVHTKAWVPPIAGLVRANGKLSQLPTSPTSVMRTKSLGIRSKVEFGKWMGEVPKLDPADYADVSITDFIRSGVSNDDTAAVAEMFVRLTSYCTEMDVMSADGFLVMTQLAMESGVQYVHEGWGSIVGSLRAVAESSGVKFALGDAVKSVRDTPGGFEVSFGDRQVAAKAVVLAAGSPEIAASIAGGVAPVLKQYAERAVPVRAACLDLCLDESPPERFALDADSPLYWGEHAPAAKLAPEGSSLVHTIRYGTTDARADRLELESWADVIHPKWRDHVVHEQFLARIVVASDIPQAALGGLAGRSPVSVPDCEGLLLAGEWVGSEGLLTEAALTSGAAAAAIAADSSGG